MGDANPISVDPQPDMSPEAFAKLQKEVESLRSAKMDMSVELNKAHQKIRLMTAQQKQAVDAFKVLQRRYVRALILHQRQFPAPPPDASRRSPPTRAGGSEGRQLGRAVGLPA